MPPSKTRYITACQQVLALGVVLAALTPAASVVSLDVVREVPGRAGYSSVGTGAPVGHLSAYTMAQARPSVLPAKPVHARVDEVSLTAAPATTGRTVSGLGRGHVTTNARSKPGPRPGSTEVTSRPEPVSGFGAVGVTWEHGVQMGDNVLSFQLRTRTADGWSDWAVLPYHDDHAPDPDSREGRRARPGTEPVVVGSVDQVQVRALSSTGTVPADMKLAVIDPGKATSTVTERGALDTNTMDGGTGDPAALVDAEAVADGTRLDTTPAAGEIALSAASYTPKPVIYSRAQWGADERMRDKSSLHYYEVHAGFVHHTVNANNYTRAEVPGIIRSIYAYHTQSKGWSDIGYNFVVDRFGRIWEARYGGIDRPVVGAHTLGYNDYSFAMSAIGNYDIAAPSSAMVQAYGALFAWKLSLHGVSASSTKQWVGTKYFQAINGHRDAGQTACPGRYLYARIPEIRKLAAAAQRGWAGRELESDLASTPHPDLVVRRASDGQAFVIPTGGLTQFNRPVAVTAPVADTDRVVASPDLTGDGRADVLVQAADGSAQVYPGDGAGGLGKSVRQSTILAGHDLLTPVGDLNGDGRNDLVGRRTSNNTLDIFAGHGDGGFSRHQIGTGWGGFDLLAGTGDLTGDGVADLVARDKSGRLWIYRGTGSAALGGRVAVAGGWSQYDTITGFGDYTGDGLADLLVRQHGQPGYVLPSRGNGTFGHAIGPIGRAAGGPVVGINLAGGAAPDLLLRSGNKLTVSPNKGTFETGRPIATGTNLKNANLLLNAGDWDRDGHGDIVTRDRTSGTLYLRRGDGRGHFGQPVSIGTGFGSVSLLAAVGDMTGDGYPDLMGQPSGAAIRIYPGNGLQGLKGSYVAHSRIDAGRQIAIGRWDGDGAPDSLFRNGSRLILFPGNGPGGLTGSKSLGLDLTPYDWVVGVSDVTLTGHPDLLVREKATGYLWLYQATSQGFQARRFMGEGMGAYDLAG